MDPYRLIWLKQNPFVRLLLPLMAGILVQEYIPLSKKYWWLLFSISLLCITCFFLLHLYRRFRNAYLNGIFISLLFFSLGGLLTWHQDIRNDAGWIGCQYNEKDKIVATLLEPPVEKPNSFKATAAVSYLIRNNQCIPVTGKVILYFKKDSSFRGGYGSQFVFCKPLQEIKNTGNPGGFDYKRYSRFQGITHQVFLTVNEAVLLPGKKQNRLTRFIYASREAIIRILQKNITAEKERGLAEAMLIGYKNDLDQSLVQSYTNTGVVHIIAISGLHLGLIYWLLNLLLRPLQKRKRIKWIRPVLIIAFLWLFTLLAGAQPSVLRSALMFTCIVLGESFSRKTSIYNTLAGSAFILLCINPYWLWDVGFQLSYLAVLSIVVFMRPVYNWFYIKNKITDTIWKMNAVTIAAQVLTLPISIYHFHQFPNYFLFTNFIAVPLSSIILLGEILLCVLSIVPAFSLFTGRLLTWLIWLMNTWIEKIETIRFSLWDGLQITIVQTLLLYLFISAACYWLMQKSVTGLKTALLALLCCMVIRSRSFLQAAGQQKIIVYNVPKKRAIDIIRGRTFQFLGDSSLMGNDPARNFHLKPARTLFRITEEEELPGKNGNIPLLYTGNKKIILIDQPVSFQHAEPLPVVHLLILSGNPKIYMKKLAATLNIRQVVFDSSVPAWKSRYWKKDCDSLHIPWHDVAENGAFETDLQK
jgi:competence protein ComEC